jgi:hypothetical protein
VVSFDDLVRSAIKKDNHHLTQEMCRAHSNLLERAQYRLIQFRQPQEPDHSLGTAAIETDAVKL